MLSLFILLVMPELLYHIVYHIHTQIPHTHIHMLIYIHTHIFHIHKYINSYTTGTYIYHKHIHIPHKYTCEDIYIWFNCNLTESFKVYLFGAWSQVLQC